MSNAMLPIIWYFIICGELALYILLDGANLGIGLLSLLPQEESERSRMFNILGPIWNANETWLLVAAGTLFGAFPAVYAIGLNALYVPGMIIVVGIIGRAVSFEFYAYATNKKVWSRVFGVASFVMVVGQGSALGGLLSGIRVAGGHFAGTLWDWATPLTLLIAIGIFCGYAVLGYAYLIKEERYANKNESFSRILTYAGLTGAALLLATLLLPRTNYLFFTRWSTPPSMYALYTIAAAIVLVACMFGYDALRMRYPARLYYECLALFALGTIGMLVGTYPYLVPPSVTIFDAASPANTLRFMLWGIGPLLPIILAYQWYLHRVFNRVMPQETPTNYSE
ncbi:MAG TPA: cytochrome d ubiquinol oxidase subunit II [Candidatus Paceibacterota bacterium]|nr:cytochrome d ubiquinol oxidase subunit II [Candidatus Paceibacterota bacterium]